MRTRPAGPSTAAPDVITGYCWDPAFDGGPAVVEVHVHRLRRKIDPRVGMPVILTLRGEGYLIQDDTE
ncbi:MAG: helix-turn-helix domain-containing protein [Actinomycetota bacterium]|nr:helix-turn-helix domain-containing protein [Actinomycetota bacterium]